MPVVYSCSGCSDIAQMANNLAVKLDRERRAEMSCIAGVRGDVPTMVNIAISNRQIIAIDGCPLECCRHSLERWGEEPGLHFVLTRM